MYYHYKSPRKIFINNNMLVAYVVSMPLLTTISVFAFQRGSIIDAFKWLIEHPIESLLNYIISFALMHVFLLFFKGKVYFVISSIIFFTLSMLGHISYIKSELRGEPLTILDYRLLGEASNISEVIDFNFFIPFIVLLVTVILFVLFIIGFTIVNSKRSTRYTTAFLSIFLLFLSYFSSIETLAKLKVEIPADVSWNHDENGFLLATLVDTKFMKIPKPEGYSKKAIKEIYTKMKNTQQFQTLENSVLPNVIFVMSESFWEPKLAESLQINKEVLPNFKRLSEESIVGEIKVPGIGGGTANTEYEVLTGLSKDYIQNYAVPYNPYNSYINRPIPSLASIFSENNYHTTAIHTYHSWFYKRNSVYKQLGFDRYLSLETIGKMPKINGLFTDDTEINQLIIDEIKRTPNKDFIFATTMQGHGPYTDMNPEDNGISINNQVSNSTKEVIENYLNNLYDIDEDLNLLVQSLKDIQEPTILVYFGDHIPPFGNEAYTEIGFDLYGEMGRKTPVMIWSNTGELEGEINFNGNMLGSYVLNLIGVKNDLFMNYLNTYSEVSPFNEKEDNKQFYRDFELLHYDIMHGEQYIYDLVGKPRINEEFMVGYPLKITRVVARKTDVAYVIDIAGMGIGWMSKAILNGKEYDVAITNGTQATVHVPIADIAPNHTIDIKLQIKDSRNKIISESNGCLRMGAWHSNNSDNSLQFKINSESNR